MYRWMEDVKTKAVRAANLGVSKRQIVERLKRADATVADLGARSR